MFKRKKKQNKTNETKQQLWGTLKPKHKFKCCALQISLQRDSFAYSFPLKTEKLECWLGEKIERKKDETISLVYVDVRSFRDGD